MLDSFQSGVLLVGGVSLMLGGWYLASARREFVAALWVSIVGLVLFRAILRPLGWSDVYEIPILFAVTGWLGYLAVRAIRSRREGSARLVLVIVVGSFVTALADEVLPVDGLWVLAGILHGVYIALAIAVFWAKDPVISVPVSTALGAILTLMALHLTCAQCSLYLLIWIPLTLGQLWVAKRRKK